MIEDGSPSFKSSETISRKFSKVPAVRKFESILPDEKFESAGFRIVRHPLSDTSIIVSDNQDLFGDDESNSNKFLRHEYAVLHTFKFAIAEPDSGAEEAPAHLQATLARLDELRVIAAEDVLTFSESSATQAVEWLGLSIAAVEPSVFLLNNGNIRFLWKRSGTQLGIQFLGDQTAQFVFLGDDEHERIFGSLKVSELMKRIDGLDLLGVLGL